MKKVLGVILVVCGALLLLFWAFGPQMTNGLFFTGGEKEVSKPVDDIKKLMIEAPSANVTIVPETRSDIKAVLRNGNGHLEVKKSGQSLQIVVEKTAWISVSFFHKGPKLDIHVPKDYQEDLQTDVRSGSVFFDGDTMRLHDLTIKSQSGNVEIANLKVKSVTSHVQSGNFKGDTIDADQTHIDAASGNVNLKHLSSALNISAKSGSVKVQMDQLTGKVGIKAWSGEVSLDLPHDADFSLDAQARSGIIKNDFELNRSKQNGASLSGTHGNGTYPITIDARSGVVHIY
ncbi:DUF4097 family beta strand repeat-containing protein [Camelliibacillus cellulosilyticus]|uniref:DUF4097 family beta strand repeat-containing protein n=1 Tax=Camelliibacillus cellulosilyticus TaxID=2174486 RepID=A0ABV9GPY1_9BACL